MHRMTKLRVLDNPENGLTDEKLKEINQGIVEKLTSIPGYFSGGSLAVEAGDVYTGRLRFFPEVGKQVFLDGSMYFWSSIVKEIAEESEKSWLITTLNSLYRLEKL